MHSTASNAPTMSLVIVDQDQDLTLAVLKNVLISHWHGPSTEPNTERQLRALRELSRHNPVGFVSLIEAWSEPPNKELRSHIVRTLGGLPVQAISTVLRGNPVQRTFATVVLTSMLFLTSPELSARTSICGSEQEAAAWIEKKLAFAPRQAELMRAMASLRV